MPGRRRLIALAGCLGLLAAALLGTAAADARQAPLPPRFAPNAVPGELIVKFEPGLRTSSRARIRAENGLTVEDELRPGLELVRIPPGESLTAAAETLERAPEIRYAEPNSIYPVALTPNDPNFPSLWGLDSPSSDSDIDAPEAWDLTTGTSVLVAVVDTGVAYNHPDLVANMWSNPDEAANGLDDDGNGLVDDLNGWDFFDGDNDPVDYDDHGTHVAGTIGARGNNAVGVTGVNWQVRLLAMRVGDSMGLTLSGIVNAFDYACAKGAKVINGSFGGSMFSQTMLDAIGRCPGTLFVFAAGNSGENVDQLPTYPCAYDAPNIICVAASTQADDLAYFSNYGAASVDLAAPGTSILSTVPPNGYAFFDGTSMASPHVAGVAALRWAKDPSATVGMVRNAILSGADAKPAFTGKVATGGRLNAYGALTAPLVEPPPPPPPPPPAPPPGDTVPPSDPAVVSTSHMRGVPSSRDTVVVTWSGASDFGSGIDGYSYQWDTNPTGSPDLLKDAEENTDAVTSPPLPRGGSYYFHLKTRDNAGNWSPGVHLGPYVILPAVPAPAPKCVVPRLRGKTLRAARSALTRSRCALGKVTRRRSSVQRGRVVAQSLRPGTQRPSNSRVAVTVSRGR